MGQINKYEVSRVSADIVNQELSSKDKALIESFDLGNIPFLIGKYQLNGTFFTPDGILLETEDDLKTYTVLGANQGDFSTEITVDPVQDALNQGYLGDVQVEYTVTNNLFSPSHSLDSEAVLFIREISLDRTEIRATSTTLAENQLQEYAQNLYQKLNTGPYFKGAILNFVDESTTSWCVNVMTEVLDGNLVVTFKTYEPLPDTVDVKSRFTVLEQIGEPVRFMVTRTVEVSEDEETGPVLRGPNFGVETEKVQTGLVSEYLNFQELFSYPRNNRKLGLYSIYKEQAVELSIDHSEFSNFIHFSSAAERLENFRYKLSLIQEYEQKLETEELEAERIRLRDLIQGIIDNFDHYDRYLYFEKTDTSWPKTNNTRPYQNASIEAAEAWFEQRLEDAQEYDNHNPDILINTIPQTIRLDTRNEPYVVFIHMVGQHFDEEWIYAKAVSTRYSGDNRLNFGISKDLVLEALRSFGLEISTTNQNLDKLFELCVPGQPYATGSEKSVTDFEQITSGSNLDLQPDYIDDYRKEVYKRIYHNVPLLLKAKGTTRGLRALISCFGIPDDLLEISVNGGANLDQEGPFFGPEYFTTSSQGRVRVDNTGSRAALMFDETSGTFISGTILSLDRQIQQTGTKYQQGTNNIEIGFRLNAQIDSQVKTYLISSSSTFDYDDIIGDPRNTEENYGNSFTLLRDQILPELRGPNGELAIRTPSAVLRLVRYYDSVLFRTLQSFVPARDVASAGAIVDDNILHRNRYKKLVPISNLGAEFNGRWVKSGSDESRWSDNLTASIETIFIDGGEAGSLQVLRGGRPGGKAPQTRSFVIKATVTSTVTESRECPTVDYIEDDGQSIGSKYEPKTVFDDSPRFNGELGGTDHEVTDGELNADNKFKKGGSTSKSLTYTLDYKFLCLPRFPVDTVLVATGTEEGLLFPVGLELSDPSKTVTVTVDGTEGYIPLIATEDSALITQLGVQLNNGAENQGWVFLQEEPEEAARYINYVGIDTSDFGKNHKEAELQRLGKNFLLPVFPGEENKMVANLSTGFAGEGNSFWDLVSDNNRGVYARTLKPDAEDQLFLSLKPEGRWQDVLDGQSVQLEQLISVTYKGNDYLPQMLATNLTRIYVQVGKMRDCVVLDFKTDTASGFNINEPGLQDYYLDWITLKGYNIEEDPWFNDPLESVKVYLSERYYISAGLNIMGVIVEDTNTGIEYEIDGNQTFYTLMERYMGCPYVFLNNGSTNYQLCIQNWV